MKIPKIYFFIALLFVSTQCDDILDLKPLDRITAEDLFGDPEGTKLYMANLYYQMPIEDFTWFPKSGFNFNTGDPNNGGFVSAMITDEAVHSERADFIANEDLRWWDSQDGKDQGYYVIRAVNILFDVIPTLNIPEEDRNRYIGEASFLRAWCYFALAKRYGGVPLITVAQGFDGDVESLKVPRNTEQETWDFVLSELDVAIENLPDEYDSRRANRWTAHALKSRVALHAASIAKFGPNAPLSGIAVDMGFVGLDPSLATNYYQQSVDASNAVMESGMFTLYNASPASREAATENYRAMFENPDLVDGEGKEAIFIRGRTIVGSNYGHNYDIWFQPAQVANTWPHPGRMNPSLDLIDMYEHYDNPGHPSPVVTTTDNITDDYTGYSAAKDYLKFDAPSDIFEGKDARLAATVVLPGTQWKGVDIIIQAGYVAPNGTATLLSKASIVVSGVTYHTYGGPVPAGYSGFDPYGGNNTKTGFSFKKFMTTNPVAPSWNQSTTDWLEFRYAEILLNYAEAYVEGNVGDEVKAFDALNAVRRRAAHTVDIPLNSENVMRERAVEFAFENKRLWDLMRRREYHLQFNNRVKHALLPVLDLRESPAKYIFIRQNVQNFGPQTFQPKDYYRPIQGIGGNGLVQNPQY
jgi:starch-binding outer membrane protein, SusD/RagB family